MLSSSVVANSITRGLFLGWTLNGFTEINANGSDRLPVSCRVVVAIREVGDTSGPVAVSE